jgi:hypothetical protein
MRSERPLPVPSWSAQNRRGRRRRDNHFVDNNSFPHRQRFCGFNGALKTVRPIIAASGVRVRLDRDQRFQSIVIMVSTGS